jgi:hypothetical protein
MEKSVFETTLKNLSLGYIATCSKTLYEHRATHKYDNERFNTYDARIFLNSFCEAVARNFEGDVRVPTIFMVLKETAKRHREFSVASFKQTTTDALLVDFINYVMREHCKSKLILFSSEIEVVNL